MLVDPDIGPFRADQRVFTAMLDGWQPYPRLNTSQRTEPDGQGAQLARITAYTRLTNNRACQLTYGSRSSCESSLDTVRRVFLPRRPVFAVAAKWCR
ncbi:hypothetical protein EKH49_15345 [Glutamicibacter sp. HZAU]|nr:hypothetical protein EKH49_15345 [Glutamicibacter sp. HZAU]